MITSEDVLLQIGAVRYKKGDGTLYIMNERLGWMAENRDTLTVSHRYIDIKKVQKSSPEGKPKVQLQVLLHDGNSSTFHFVNPKGVKAMVQDRDKVKELLNQLLPNFKRKVDKELEEKCRILTENPRLLQLYKDLVIPKVINSEEFWNTHAKDYAIKNTPVVQDIGVSAAFLSDIKPQTDGCNGLRYNLSAEIVHSIFKTYPAVKRKHNENVPSKMTEAEFWTKFFQSHYFHRDRLTSGTKDIFTECGKIDDQTLKAAVQKGEGDPLLDIKSFEDIQLDDGFGGVSKGVDKINSGNYVHQNMIKRFNQHSIMVLRTCTDVNSSSSGNGPVPNLSSSGSKNKEKNDGPSVSSNSDKSKNKDSKKENVNQSNVTTENGNQEKPNKRQRIMEKIHYDDLGDPVNDPVVEEKPPNKTIKIAPERMERYLLGPVPDLVQAEQCDDLQPVDEVQGIMRQATETWGQRTSHRQFINATSAVNALGDLSPGGALMRGFQQQSAGQLLPPEFEKDLENIYLSLFELLKHFWKCFPPLTPELEDKWNRTHEAIQRFKEAKLAPFEERAIRELSPLGATLTKHLNRLIQAANRKYANWEENSMRHQRR